MEQELLYKYFKGTTSEEEERLILDWVDASPENRKAFQKERMLYDIALFTDEKQMNRKDRKARIIPMLRWSARIAAVVIVAISFGFLFKNYQYEKSACQQTITVPAGQRAQITLADGTKVWLNSKSTLTYASNFGRKERNVELDGEAYFEVTQEQGRPFYVESELLTVKVLGTVFDVKVYEEDTRVYTTLVSGSVEVTDRQGEKRKIVPGEQFSLDTKTGQSTVTTVDVEIATAWKEGIFYFKDEPLEEIMKILARWYNLDIFYAGEQMKQTVYSGKMKMYVSVEDILRKFEKSGDLHFELKGKALTVYGK